MEMPEKITAYRGHDQLWWTDEVRPRPNGAIYIRLDLAESKVEADRLRREREAFEAGMQESANRLQFMNTIGRFDAVDQAFAAFQSRREKKGEK